MLQPVFATLGLNLWKLPQTHKPSKTDRKKAHKATWTRISENLVRHANSRIYYLRIKCKGKQPKRSLGTTYRKLANRMLIEKLADL